MSYIGFAIGVFLGSILYRIYKDWRDVAYAKIDEDEDFPMIRKAEWYSHDSKVRRIVDLNDNHLLNAQKFQRRKVWTAKAKLRRLNRELHFRELSQLDKVAPDLEIEDYD